MNCQILAIDIFDFAVLLTSNNIIQDAKSLFDASAKLQCSQNISEWNYECGSLKFSIEGCVAGSIPQKVNLIDIVFNISLAGIFQNDLNNVCNPLRDLSFDIELEGYRDLPDKIDVFYASWHLDKNIKSPNYTYIHPEYHLTFGGNKLEQKGVDSFGSALILPTPRIAYPPMDVILGIDFILQNYFPSEKVYKLIEDSRYKEIVFNSQQRLWKPYYLVLSSVWNSLPDTTFEQGFEPFNLNPHIHKA
ncbi:MAG TPA: hypothetical protein VLZ75_01750 [Chitinophagales bacterium]|nr:hypothetical protein [Chitinophagales bacterium]